MSDDIIVMSKGRIQQKGPPHDIYARPANAYVSSFIGIANLLKGRVVEVTGPGRGMIEVIEDGATVRLPCRLGDGMVLGAATVVSIRPENVRALRESNGMGTLEGEVLQAIFLGNCVDCRVRWGAFEWRVLAHPRDQLRAGERIYLRLDPEHTLAVRP
jgi:iron(III) transport system ATP-binding protein